MDYWATATGRAPKVVLCEQCGMEYVYVLEATGKGQGTSMLFLDNEGAEARSQAAAEAQMLYTLEHDCAVVPCPGCAHVQQHMIPKARATRCLWMKKVAFWGALLAPMFCFFACGAGAAGQKGDEGAEMMAVPLWVAAALAGASAIVLWPVRFLLCRRYDPNAEPLEARRQKAWEGAMPKEEFMRALAASAPVSQPDENNPAH
jgi:hypothetical protein